MQRGRIRVSPNKRPSPFGALRSSDGQRTGAGHLIAKPSQAAFALHPGNRARNSACSRLLVAEHSRAAWGQSKMRIVGILAGCAGALTAFTCFAYPMQGVGATSCAEFARMYRNSPEYTELVFFSWGQGYMSGLNISAMGQGFLARDLAGDMAQQQQEIRRYCADNPLKNYKDAVFDLYGKLPPYAGDAAKPSGQK